MTALGAELCASLARLAALAEDLRRIEPTEHATLMRGVTAWLARETRAEAKRQRQRGPRKTLAEVTP